MLVDKSLQYYTLRTNLEHAISRIVYDNYIQDNYPLQSRVYNVREELGLTEKVRG